MATPFNPLGPMKKAKASETMPPQQDSNSDQQMEAPAHQEPDEDDPLQLDQQTPTPAKLSDEELKQNPAELMSDETDEGDEVDGDEQQDSGREQQDP